MADIARPPALSTPTSRRPSPQARSPKSPPLSPLQKLLAMDERPLQTTLKLKEREYAPPKKLTIRELRITHKAATTVVSTSVKRVAKVLSFAEALQLQAAAVHRAVAHVDLDVREARRLDGRPQVLEWHEGLHAERPVHAGRQAVALQH